MARYRLWRELRVPIGPILTFWNDVVVYVRDDVPLSVAPSAAGAGHASRFGRGSMDSTGRETRGDAP